MTKVITVNERGALTLPREMRDRLGVTRGGHRGYYFVIGHGVLTFGLKSVERPRQPYVDAEQTRRLRRVDVPHTRYVVGETVPD